MPHLTGSPGLLGIQDIEIPTEATIDDGGAEGVDIAIVHMMMRRAAGSLVYKPVRFHSFTLAIVTLMKSPTPSSALACDARGSGTQMAVRCLRQAGEPCREVTGVTRPPNVCEGMCQEACEHTGTRG